MIRSNKRESLLLLTGDLIAFYLSLWLMLLLRYQGTPSRELLAAHAAPFTILFLVWVVIFFIAGLYEKHTLILKSKITSTILNAQIINILLAVLFFYLIDYFGITPKTNLFIYVVISFALVLLWRLGFFPTMQGKKRYSALVIGSGEEMKDLVEEVNNNPRYDLQFISSVDIDTVPRLDFQEEILQRVYGENVQVIAVDFNNEKVEPLIPPLYNLIFSRVKFVDLHKLYEEIFDRIPLSLVKYSWFLENISVSTVKGYDFLKRIMDVVLSLGLGIISLTFYPFVWLMIKMEDGGPVFFSQERVGKNNKIFKLWKFRTMPDHGEAGGVAKPGTLPTKVGRLLRRTRIDELPQLWNVLRGDLSMIGPRPEVPRLVKVYEAEIPYYNIRHLIKPGLSGWAQIYHDAPPKFQAGVDETRKKLSYDLYYLKNRSLVIDLKVVLRTIKAILSREGI